jgi:hypothetical protein
MKKYFIAIVSIFLFIADIYAQGENSSVQTDERLAAIDKIASEIKSNMSRYKITEKHRDSTGYHNAYYKKDDLQMVVTYYKDTATEKRGEWYFYKGKFIYSLKLWTDVKTKDTLDYERFYLSNERLIAWFKFETPMDNNTVVFKKLNYRMRDYIADLKRENQK